MSDLRGRSPIITRFFRHYLLDEDAARFIKSTSQHYTVPTLERLAEYGSRIVRRAATLALGFVGSYDSSPVLARALHDEDRAVRILADSGIRELWQRDGSEEQRLQLKAVSRLIASQQYRRAVKSAGHLIDQAPGFAEAWYQRAVAHFFLDQYEQAANDCQQTLELNPNHFSASVRMAHCYLELMEVHAALEYFRRALQLNPDLEGVRAQAEHLQRSIGGT